MSLTRFTFIVISLLFLSFTSFAQQSEIDSLEQLLPSAKDTARVKILVDLTLDYEYIDAEKAFQYGEECLLLAKKTGFKKGEANISMNLGLLYADKSDYSSSKKYATNALKIYEELGQDADIAQAYTNLGVIADYESQYPKAIEYYGKALAISEKLKDDYGISGALYNLGLIYNARGDYHMAMQHWSRALKIFVATDEKEGISSVYLAMGGVYKQQLNFPKAIENYEAALKMAEQINDPSLIGDIYIGFGNAYLEIKKDYVSALNYFEKSKQIFQKMDNISGVAITTFNMADIKNEQGQYDAALKLYAQSEKAFLETNDQLGYMKCLNHEGNVYIGKKEYDKAIANCLKSLKIAEEMHLKEDLVDNYNLLADAYNLKGDNKEAFRYHKLYSEMKDSILNESNSKHILELQSRFDTDKKQHEIELLQKQSEIKDIDLAKKRVIIYSVAAALILLLILSLVVYNRYQIKRKANLQLEEQNNKIQLQKSIIEEKNKDITDSIVYAKRIQEAILPPVEKIRTHLPQSFILYKPKDIVSGDFYFFDHTENNSIVIAAVDCTGHGVPGAFMSIVGHNAINQCVNEYKLNSPGEILKRLNKLVTNNLHSGEKVSDGMDISLCTIDPGKSKLSYAGAFNPLYHIRDGSLTEVKADKIMIGSLSGEDAVFTEHAVELQKGDVFYLFSDGYADQFGGPKGKKFKYKTLQQLLVDIHSKPMHEQHEILKNTIEAWQGGLEQVDDILIIGFRI